MEPSDSYINLTAPNLRKRLQKAETGFATLMDRYDRSAKALDTLRFISAISEQTLDCGLLLNRVLPKVSQTLDCDLAVFYRNEGTAQRLTLTSTCGRPGRFAPPPERLEGTDYAALADYLAKPELPSNLQPILAASLAAGSLKSYLVEAGLPVSLLIPICAGNLNYGIFLLGFTANRGIDPAEEAFLISFMTQLGATVERIRFLDAFHQVEKLSTLGEIMAGIAHELHNPLTVVIGFAELLSHRTLDPKSRAMAEKIFGEALRSKKIVNNLLVFSKRRPSQNIFVDIHAIIDEALELASYELRVSNIRVKRRFDPLVNESLGDPHLLKQVFFNVITNSYQALLAQGTGGELSISTEARKDTINVRFTDTGPGVPKELRTKIFEPFFTTKTSTNGTGLGLSLAQKILERHGGSIGYEPSVSGGASFVIALPAALASRPAPDPPRVAADPGPVQPGRILIVDDEPMILELLSEILAEDQHTITVTGNASTALEYISANSYDCILCDLKMPGMSGRELFDRILEVKPDLTRRLIFITGDFLSDETEAFMLESKIPFIKKPFVVDEVCILINEIISRRPA